MEDSIQDIYDVAPEGFGIPHPTRNLDSPSLEPALSKKPSKRKKKETSSPSVPTGKLTKISTLVDESTWFFLFLLAKRQGKSLSALIADCLKNEIHKRRELFDQIQKVLFE